MTCGSNYYLRVLSMVENMDESIITVLFATLSWWIHNLLQKIVVDKL